MSHSNLQSSSAAAGINGRSLRPASLWTSIRRPLRSAVARRHLAFAVLIAPIVMLGFSAAEAWGCPTCKDGIAAPDDASANLARGYFYSILLMLAMPFTLASCFGLYVWREYRRQQRAGVFDHSGVPSGTAPLGVATPAVSNGSGLVEPVSPFTVSTHAS